MTKSFFITGIGTDIGKTVITCALCHQLTKKGKSVSALKPVISGWDGSKNTDTNQLLRSIGQNESIENIDKVSPWRFEAPLSPDMAAQKEGKTINFHEVVEYCQKNIETSEYNFVEGAGGVMVPFNDSFTYLDLISQLNIPVILITGNYLGAISHTLTALGSLKKCNINAVVINQSKNGVNIDDTIKTLSNFTDEKIFTTPYIDSQTPWLDMPDITDIVA